MTNNSCFSVSFLQTFEVLQFIKITDAITRCQDAKMEDVALKMLEPVEPGLGARASSVSAYKVCFHCFQLHQYIFRDHNITKIFLCYGV